MAKILKALTCFRTFPTSRHVLCQGEGVNLPLLKPLFPFISLAVRVTGFPVGREKSRFIPLNLNYSIVRIINAVFQTVHKRYPDLVLSLQSRYNDINRLLIRESIRSVHESKTGVDTRTA